VPVVIFLSSMPQAEQQSGTINLEE